MQEVQHLGQVCGHPPGPGPVTVDSPPGGTGPKRGYRRVQWIEAAVAPWRDTLGPDRFQALVSSLAMVAGWEGFIVLTDIRGLDPGRARAVSVATAMALIRAATDSVRGDDQLARSYEKPDRAR